MADKDKYGNYVNDKGVTIKITTDKKGNDHISFYGGEVDKPHDAAHVNVNYDKGTWSSTTHGPDKSDTSSGIGGCYLTSACMKYSQEKFDDNCYELTVLRWFRDNFVSKEDIEHYYEVAPIIVETINKEEKSDIIYNYIYDNVVDYCVEQIEKGNYDAAYNRYKSSVLTLENNFAKTALVSRLVKTLKIQTNN